MLVIFLIAIFYIALTVFSTSFLTSLSVPVFLIVLYILPILINLVFTKLQKTDKGKLIFSLLLPTISVVFYILFAYFTSQSGSWMEFVKMNTISEERVSVEISENLMSIGQVVFALLSYYASSLGYYLISKLSKKSKVKGVRYA